MYIHQHDMNIPREAWVCADMIAMFVLSHDLYETADFSKGAHPRSLVLPELCTCDQPVKNLLKCSTMVGN